jgi:hypothetical protein
LIFDGISKFEALNAEIIHKFVGARLALRKQTHVEQNSPTIMRDKLRILCGVVTLFLGGVLQTKTSPA